MLKICYEDVPRQMSWQASACSQSSEDQDLGILLSDLPTICQVISKLRHKSMLPSYVVIIQGLSPSNCLYMCL